MSNYELIGEDKVKIEFSKLDLVKIIYLAKFALSNLANKLNEYKECKHSIKENNYNLGIIYEIRELITPAIIALSHDTTSDEHRELTNCKE